MRRVRARADREPERDTEEQRHGDPKTPMPCRRGAHGTSVDPPKDRRQYVDKIVAGASPGIDEVL